MTLQKSLRKNRAGFTLIELLLVIAIIAILSALGLSVMAGAEQDALETRTRAGIERISGVLNQKLEEYRYRILPVRLPVDAEPSEIRDFRNQAMPEFLRVEFPFLLVQANPTTRFPQNAGPSGGPQSLVDLFLTQADLPQMVYRYEAKVAGATTTNQSAELLYAILSLSFDEFGQPLSAVLREREIGDTDGDGVNEVLDAFGDPLDFKLYVRLDEDDFASIPAGDIVRTELNDFVGYEAILDQDQALFEGQVRGPRPLEEYRLVITSVNLTNTDSGAVVTQ